MLFGVFALILISVYWINRAVSLFDQLLADGQSARVVLEFTALTLPFVIRVVLPLAGFVAAVQTANRLSAESEMVVMQSSGMSPWRLARPVLVFGLIGALLMGLLGHWLVPASRARLADRQAELAQSITSQFLTEGSFLYPAPGLTLFIRKISDRGELLGMFLSDARKPGSDTIYTAEKALLVRAETGPKLIMISGMSQVVRRGENGVAPRLSLTRFDDFTYDLADLISPGARDSRDLREFATHKLIADPAGVLALSGESPQTLRIELHERLAQPLQFPVAVLVGWAAMLLGGFSRFGMTRQVLGAVAALIVIQFLDNAVSNLARKSPDLWPLLWVPALFGMALAAAALTLASARRRRPAPAGAPA